MQTLAERLVSDQLWELARPLLPRPPRHPRGGRPRSVPDRNCLAGIVFMAITSTPWRLLPASELRCGSPATCWRRFAEWTLAGVFDRLHLELLDRLGRRGLLDWSRAAIDTYSLRARSGGAMWAQIRSTVASPAPSSTWSTTPSESRWPPRLTPPTSTTASCSRRCSTISRQSAPRRASDSAGPANSTPTRHMTCALPRLSAPARHHRQDRPPRRGILHQAGPAPLAGGALAVVAELLPPTAGALGSLLGPVLCVRAAGLRDGVPQPAQRPSDGSPSSRPRECPVGSPLDVQLP
jgi:transposase